jgi:hypothetical protein
MKKQTHRHWTTEIPKERGYYWLYYHANLDIGWKMTCLKICVGTEKSFVEDENGRYVEAKTYLEKILADTFWWKKAKSPIPPDERYVERLP